MKNRILHVILPMVLLFAIASGWAKTYTLNCGRFRLTNEETSFHRIFFPADFDADQLDSYGQIAFMSRDWKSMDGIVTSKAMARNNYFISSKKTVKYPYSTIKVNGVDITTPAEYDAVDPNLIADQMMEMVFNNAMGIRVIARSYAFSHPDYQDFAFTHYMIVNTGEANDKAGVDLPGQQLKGLHFLITGFSEGRFCGFRMNPGSNVADANHPGFSSYWIDTSGGEPGDSLGLFYGWDGDDPINGPYEDEGNPAFTTTWEFLTPYYEGVGLVHADKNVKDRSHDQTKLVAIKRAGRYEYNSITEDELFNYLATPGNFPVHIQPDIPGASPRTEQEPAMNMSVGPYDLAFGDTVNIVIFFGVAGRSTEECREWGAKYKRGEITDDQKNAFLRWGKNALFNLMGKAVRFWKSGLKIPNGWNPLPPGSFSLQNGPGKVFLSWSGVSGASSYNVYRALGVQDSVVYSLVADKLTATNYVDENVKKGFNYYYNLTAADSKGIESSKYWLRSSRKSVVPFTAQGKTMADVRVVPNPFLYDRSAKTNYVGQKDKLVFAGLPGPCKIKIYTQSGDLVDEFDHTTQEGIHEWFNITKFNQYVASGVYVFYVESTEGKGSVFGKFIVIR